MPREIEKPVAAGGPFRIGGWLVDPSLNRLSRANTTIHLELKVMDVLVCLAEQDGELVTRQQLIDTVWATEYVSDNSLTHAIAELRNAFGDDARNPSFIETIHRRGYRLIASIEAEVSDKPGISRVARFPVPERAVEDNRNPYPGLAAFTQADAEFFFGREAEVVQMWRKLTSRRLLAVIGPSGVGKSSFLRAGVIPAKPEGWGVVVCQPGEAPFAGLARALVPEFSGDDEAMEGLVGVRDEVSAVAAVSRWCHQYDEALLIVDQFEELFTLNPPEVQPTFAGLLRRLVDDDDVHILLSMRDDFLYRCHDHEALEPVFDSLTPVKAPDGEALRRALVEPAKKQGYAFDDDDLPGEMVAEVEGQRGALPMLAFAVARLWEERDTEKSELTRSAYKGIGGVSGSLAQHAESTLTAIGQERLPIVREVFRNLVTAQGTRAVRSVDDLMTVFPEPQRVDAEQVMRRLIDARLLTSFEEEGIDGDGHHRVEVVHESLLSSWPRLVGWQTQDADSVRLRDELRQAARTWGDHGRTTDFLWTGKAYREFSVWRENYPGGLTESEEGFARAMTAHAKRRKRRRRIAVAASIVLLLAGLAVVGSFWQRSVREARRAEAAHLVSLGQLELESYPSATVAHAITSLELADGPGARRLALEALWKGPTALVATEDFAWEGRFSPDGRWLVQARYSYADKGEGHLSIIRADGSSEFLENAHPEASNVHLSMITHAGHFVSFGLGADSTREYIIWSVSGRRALAQTRYEESSSVLGFRLDSDRRRLVLMVLKNGQASIDVLGFDGTQQRLGTLDFQYPTVDDWYRNAALDPRIGRSLAAVVENEVLVFEIGDGRLSEPRRLGRIDGAVADIALDPLGRFVTTADAEGEIRLWSLTETLPPAVLQGPPAIRFLRITIDGSLLEAAVQKEGNWISWVWALSENPPRLLRRFYLGKTLVGGWEWDAAGRKVARCGADPKIRIWSMDAPVDAEPLVLNRGNNVQMNSVSFNLGGSWLATADLAGLAVWPLAKRYSAVIGRHDSRVIGLDFAPSGEWLASSVTNNPVRLWPLEGNPPPPGRELGPGRGRLAASLDGTRVLVGSPGPGAQVLFPNGDPPLTLAGFRGLVWGVALSPDGRLAAAAGGLEDPADRVIRVWDVASGKQVTVLEVGERPYAYNLNFTLDGHLLSASESGLLRWDVATGERELLYQGMVISFAASADGRRVLMVEGKDASDVWGQAVLLELESSTVTRLDRFGEDVTSVAIDPAGTIAITGDRDGEVRVGSVIGEEPHLLPGHESTVWALAIDPRGRWIASGSEGGTIRLWPMPDLSKPPLHTLPREELIAKLKTLTNLRVVRDEDSPTGWTLTHDPFPGWETVPTW